MRTFAKIETTMLLSKDSHLHIYKILHYMPIKRSMGLFPLGVFYIIIL